MLRACCARGGGATAVLFAGPCCYPTLCHCYHGVSCHCSVPLNSYHVGVKGCRGAPEGVDFHNSAQLRTL
eukprot:1158914-Pelagomonas_calceolata.AAC.2